MQDSSSDKQREILVFRHEEMEDLGNFEPVLEDSGIPWRYVDFWDDPEQRPEVDDACGLIVLGGGMGCYDVEEHPFLSFEEYFINHFHRYRRPILGVCLGGQLINTTFNCIVQPMDKPEIGFAPVYLSDKGKRDPLFSHFGEQEVMFHYHHDEMDDVPVGGHMLASSSQTWLQAFRLDSTCYALQFHPEVDGEVLEERWLSRERIRDKVLEHSGADSVEQIRQQAEQHHERIRELSQGFFRKWLGLVEERGEGNHWGPGYSYDKRAKHAPPPSERMG